MENQKEVTKKAYGESKHMLIAAAVSIAIGGILFYLLLPAINIKSAFTWVVGFFVYVIFASTTVILNNASAMPYQETKMSSIRVSLFGLAILVIFIMTLISASSMFNARRYASIMEPNITTDEFSNYMATMDTVPLMDKESAMLIANRKMGSLEDVVSQFEIHDSEQITVQGKSARVSILNYTGFFKWMNNKYTGTPGYIVVDMQEQKAELVRVDGGIRYSKGEFFGRDINRHLRFNYPTLMFGDPSIELDEEGNPIWVTPVYDNTIGLFGGKDVTGIVTVDAVTGDHTRYSVEDVPLWVDNVYPSALMISHYDYYGILQNGFLNSIFGQKGVKETTEGYNYIPQGDDNWIYTGVTSVARDESNIGFLLMNKRTKETIYYPLGGAEEYSAMASAEGMVQHLGYISTFPLLLQVEGQPTYLVALKDAGGLVKMYGMINVESYQIVATGTSIRDTQEKYRALLNENDIETPENIHTEEIEETENDYLDTVEGTITEIKTAIKNGNTHYYLQLMEPGEWEIENQVVNGEEVQVRKMKVNEDNYYELNIMESETAILLEVGDIVTLEVEEIDKTIVPARMLEE